MKKYIVLLFTLMMSIVSAYAETWVPSGNTKAPIIFVDTDNIYKTISNNTVYAIRYFKDNNVGDIISTVYADFDENTAAIIDSHPYKKDLPYDFKIDDTLKMQPVDVNSSIYSSYIMVKNIAQKKKLKECPEKFQMYDKYKNIIAFKNTGFSVKMQEKFENLESGMTVHFVVNPRTLKNSDIYWTNVEPNGNIYRAYFVARVNDVISESNYSSSSGRYYTTYYVSFDVEDLYINNKQYYVNAKVDASHKGYVSENPFTYNYNITLGFDLETSDERK